MGGLEKQVATWIDFWSGGWTRIQKDSQTNDTKEHIIKKEI